MLSSQEVITIVVVIGVFFCGIFYFRRFSGIKTDTRLYLKQKPVRRLPSNEGQSLDPSTLAESDDIGRTKTLNVLFMYNGHSFDAHEILGIPPGAGLKTVEEARQRLLKTVNPESREFIEAAYQVLKKELRRHS